MTSQLHFKDDPTATYRGYRRQALYCLFRLFDDGLPKDCIVQPEGYEDLAIYDDNGDLLEVHIALASPTHVAAELTRDG